jgi:hypothetical protein
MTTTHFYLAHHTRTPQDGGGAHVVRYLERTGEFAPTDATRLVAYDERTGGQKKDYADLRDKDVANLPRWAVQNPQRFFEAAYQYEGAGRRWATSMQANFPRAFSLEQQGTFMRAFVATHLKGRPLLWVIHQPMARDGSGAQPHAHLLWSERLRPLGQPEAAPEVLFKRPEAGGYPKYVFGRGDRHAIYRMREAWCASINTVVDREGHGTESLMDPRSFLARGIIRQAVREQVVKNDLGQYERMPPVDERTPADRVHECQLAVDWWARYKQTMGLTPAMDQATALRVIAREVREPGARAHERAQAAQSTQPRQADYTPLIGNVRSKIYHAPGDPSYGDVQPRNQVLFSSHDAAAAAGYRPAVNQHYAAGAALRLQRSIARVERYQRQLSEAQKQKITERTNPVVLRKIDYLLSYDVDHEEEAAVAQGGTFHFQKDRDVSR